MRRAAEPPGTWFHAFALTCSQIGATAKKLEKISVLASYLKGLDESGVRLVSAWFTGYPFPPVENKVLQLGWAIVRDALCGVARIDQGHFGQCYLQHSDLERRPLNCCSRQRPRGRILTLPEIDALFNSLHAARGPLGKLPLLTRVLQRCTALGREISGQDSHG